MGSLFSSPAAAVDPSTMGSLLSSPPAGKRKCDGRNLLSLIPKEERQRLVRPGRIMSKEMLASLDQGHDGRRFTIEEVYSGCICILAHRALKHYNANNLGAEFQHPASEMKAACTGFKEGFVWYHLSFSARRTDNQEMHLFFAELCYDIEDTQKLILKTRTILEKPSRCSCAFCPEESKIMHPSEAEFVCGKEGQKTEFFRMRHMLLWPWEDTTGDLEL